MKKELVSLKGIAGYLEARILLKDRGLKLASNVLHDDHLVMTDGFLGPGPRYPAWAREILVHPEKGGRFRKGDIVDSVTGWTLPANFLTDPRFIKGDAFREGVGLFLDPETIMKDNGRVVVVPASIVLISPFIQEAGCQSGEMDALTRIPLNLGMLREERLLRRIAGVGVRPIVRNPAGSIDYYDRRTICCDFTPDVCFGVVGEAAGKTQG